MSGPSTQPDVNGVATRLSTMVLRGCVWQSRSSGPQWLPKRIGKVREDEGTIWLYFLVYLRRCGDGPLRPEGCHSMTTHPLIHDDPGCQPNRIAFTLTGPSPILRCGFGKGTPVSMSTEPFVIVPLLSPFFGLVLGLVCPRRMVDWFQCVCAAVVAFLLGFVRSRFLMDMWVAEGHTAR